MKLPHVTIEYREEETDAIGKMSPAMIVGFGLHWSWVYLVMYSGGDLFRVEESAYRSSVFIVSLVVFAAVLLSYGVLLDRYRRLFATAKLRSRNRMFAAIAMSVGVIAAALLPAFPYALAPLGALAGVLSGMGSAVLLMSFGVSFSVCDIAESAVSAAFSFVVAAFSFAAIVVIDDVAHPLGVIACVVLPFIEVACLGSCSRKMVDNLEFSMITIPVHAIPFGVRLCLPCVVIGVVLGFVRGGAFTAGTELVSFDGALIICLASIASCAFVLVAMLSQRKTSYFMFRTLMPIAAVLLALVVTPIVQDGVSLAFVTYTVCFMLDASMWVSLSDVSQRYRVSAFTVFGFGRAALASGTILSVFAIPVETAIVLPTSGEAASLVIGALVLMILGYALLPTGIELRQTLDRSATCPAFVNEDDFSPGGVWGRRPGSLLRGRKSSCPNDEGVSDADSMRVEGGFGEEASPVAANLGGEGLDASRANRSSEADAQSKCHAQEQIEGFSVERMGRFKRKCAMVADTFLLSRKETEVLFLLAKGRNSSAIQEMLYISAGTANTHMRNIYRKLDVHSQQELIALVESMDDAE